MKYCWHLNSTASLRLTLFWVHNRQLEDHTFDKRCIGLKSRAAALIILLTLTLTWFLSLFPAAVTVESVPAVGNGGFIQTKLDHTVSLSCSAPSAGEELQWFRNGVPVALPEGNRVDHSRLCVQPVTREDHGVMFLCQLKNNAALNGSVQLEVTCELGRRGCRPSPTICCQGAPGQWLEKAREEESHNTLSNGCLMLCWMLENCETNWQ